MKETDAGATPARESDEQEPMLYCPNVPRASPRECKLICEQCGYYLSCADYY